VAPARFAEAYLDVLAEWLLHRNPGIDAHLCDTAAEDAIISLISVPLQYDAQRGALDAYLRMAAQGDLRNLLEKERRHSSRRTNLEPVEFPGRDRNNEQDAEFDLVEAWDDEESELLKDVRERMMSTFTPGEQRTLLLMIEGERKTAVYAQALGIADLPELEQRRQVKQAKDRITKRLRRARSES
jgi:hypothetical protein